MFTPELKIDLARFVEDQIFFHKIAKFLDSLATPQDKKAIAKHFEASPLSSELKALFKQDPTPFLELFYEACVDVLNKKPFSHELKSAISGRIFTLKNALFAMHNPQAIQRNQAEFKLPVQTLSEITQEGAIFVREFLRIHLEDLKNGQEVQFKERLTLTAQQLIPFVQRVTKSYLLENGKTLPDNNPLAFRNPTGYNYHGFVASTVLEVVLSALGYNTRLMSRIDLEPKVTLATAHNIVEVTGPDGAKYIVDPCYLQFHKDVCSDDQLLPGNPLLVLRETEVDQYVENALMPHFKANAQSFSTQDSQAIRNLSERDQIVPFMIRRMPVPPECVPANVENWVRASLKRVWELRSYAPILSNCGVQEIFFGTKTAHKTYELIKAMGIGPMSHLTSQTLKPIRPC